MSNENKEGREREVRDRIVSLIRANEQIHKKQIAREELQALKIAAGRLDQMLREAEDEDLQSLRTAAARLDQLLADIGSGKDVTTEIKRRRS